jgi:DNA-binding Xre family transcriptional regulator
MRLNEAVTLRLQELCFERRITIHELSLITDVSYSTLYNAVTEKTIAIRMHTIENICFGLDISIADFFKSGYFSQHLDL